MKLPERFCTIDGQIFSTKRNFVILEERDDIALAYARVPNTNGFGHSKEYFAFTGSMGASGKMLGLGYGDELHLPGGVVGWYLGCNSDSAEDVAAAFQMIEALKKMGMAVANA